MTSSSSLDAESDTVLVKKGEAAKFKVKVYGVGTESSDKVSTVRYHITSSHMP